MKRRLFIGLSAALLLAACATAGGQSGLIPLWKDFEDHPKGYFGQGPSPRAEDFLAPPPSLDSPRGQSDMAVYRATRKLEGSPRWTIAQGDADLETPNAPKLFDCALGVSLDIAAQPVLMRLLARASDDSDEVGRGAKEKYLRKRPFLIEDGPTCVAKADWLIKQGSYSSGHSANGWTWALILSELAPSRADAVLKRGQEIGESRVVCGVHYASDIDAGRLVGASAVAALHNNPAFQADFVRARRELDAALRSGPRPPAAQCAAEAQALAVRPY